MSLLTELEAVNIILQAAGEAPIQTFADAQQNELPQSAQARGILQETSVSVQNSCWSFNEMRCVRIDKNADGEFPVPDNWLRVEFQPVGTNLSYQQRGTRIYDASNNTYQIEADFITADRVIVALPWEQLPYAAKYYITKMAANVYVTRLLNNDQLNEQTQIEMIRAHQVLMREEHTKRPANMLWDTGETNAPYSAAAVPARGMRYRRGA
jgi:hypothetical protein